LNRRVVLPASQSPAGVSIGGVVRDGGPTPYELGLTRRLRSTRRPRCSSCTAAWSRANSGSSAARVAVPS